MNKKHSPGPWSVDDYTLAILDAEGFQIGYAQHNIDPAQAKADAPLLAAAPELLATLTELYTAIRAGSYEDPAHDRIYQALLDAKALIEKNQTKADDYLVATVEQTRKGDRT